ncbi:hypothetical protein J6590_084020 [Homalodisca vitripennis]|nr:hypothetical protein J6590_084020 [Homalodisca vitripennis]
MDGLVKPGADISYVYNQASKAQPRPIFLLAGTNNRWTGSLQDIYQEMEIKLLALSQSRPVCITTIPPRFDVQSNDAIHYDIALANNYIRELVSRMNNVDLIDLELFERHCFTKHGLHLNYKGKKKLAFKIISSIKNLVTKQHVTVASGDGSLTVNNLENPSHDNVTNLEAINILNSNMADVIKNYRHKKKVGFAHSISADFHDKRHMTAGVAVVFKKQFGKPNTAHCITRHLALQDSPNGASVYSLITKSRYYNKPTAQDYNAAFSDLEANFKSRELDHLLFLITAQPMIMHLLTKKIRNTTVQLNVTPLAHVQPTVAASKTSAKVIVVPGDLTYSEALKLKQSMSECVSSVSPVVINVNKSQEVCTVNEEDLLNHAEPEFVINRNSSRILKAVKNRNVIELQDLLDNGKEHNGDKGSADSDTYEQAVKLLLERGVQVIYLIKTTDNLALKLQD